VQDDGGLPSGIPALLPEDEVPIANVEHAELVRLNVGVQARHGVRSITERLRSVDSNRISQR